MEPSHTTHNHTVGFIKLPTGEGTGERVVLIVKGKQIRPVAAIILHINPDLAVVSAVVRHILTGHDAVGIHLTVGQHAHLERRGLVKREVQALGIGNRCTIGAGSLTVGRIDQHGALGRRFHVHVNGGIVVATGTADHRIAIDEVLLDIAVHLVGQ